MTACWEQVVYAVSSLALLAGLGFTINDIVTDFREDKSALQKSADFLMLGSTCFAIASTITTMAGIEAGVAVLGYEVSLASTLGPIGAVLGVAAVAITIAMYAPISCSLFGILLR